MLPAEIIIKISLHIGFDDLLNLYEAMDWDINVRQLRKYFQHKYPQIVCFHCKKIILYMEPFNKCAHNKGSCVPCGTDCALDTLFVKK